MRRLMLAGAALLLLALGLWTVSLHSPPAARARQSAAWPVPPATVVPGPAVDNDWAPPAIPPVPALPAAPGPVQYAHSWTTPDLTGWTARPALPGDAPATWRVLGGRLQQLGNDVQVATADPAVLLGPPASGTFAWEAALLPEGGEPVGLVWNATADGYDRVVFYAAPQPGVGVTVSLEHVTVWNRATVRGTVTSARWPGWTGNHWLLAQVRVGSGQVTVLVNGTVVLTVAQAPAAGQVGIYASTAEDAAVGPVRLSAPATAPPGGPGSMPLPPRTDPLTGRGAAPNDTWEAWQDISAGHGTYGNRGGVSGLLDGRFVAAWDEIDSHSGDFTALAGWNTTLGGPEVGVRELARQSSSGSIVNVVQAKDRFNQVNIVWAWQHSATSADIYFARLDGNGNYLLAPRAIPGSASSGSALRKDTAIAVDASGRVHVAWGRDNNGVSYASSTDGQNWTTPSQLPTGQYIKTNQCLSVGATTDGTPFVAWIDYNQDPNGDVVVAERVNNTWQVQDVSAGVGNYAHSPALIGDNSGGMRLTWDDSPTARQPDGAAPLDRPNNDIYYREWHAGSGWDNHIYGVVANGGDSLAPHMAIDDAGLMHIVWNDDTGYAHGDQRVWYGLGNAAQGFTAYSLAPWTRDIYSKDPGVDTGGGAVHVTYAMVVSGQKDRYYIWRHYLGGTPLPTSTATPTLTRTPTRTPVASPTPQCPLTERFADVCPPNPFYVYISDLASLGAISGYACGGPGEPCSATNQPYFRPANQIFRGQFTKVVLLALSIPIQPGNTQLFDDVPSTHPYYAFVNTAALRGIISGYACGGTGEPCHPPGNLPYFRPYNNITRGQASKVLVLARQWTLLDPLTATFTDVARGSVFFRFVETAYRQGIISGYSSAPPCTTGVPCFLPNNAITRGQAAKVIDLARLVTATPTPTVTPHGPSSTPTPRTTGTLVPTATPFPATVTATRTPFSGTGTPTATPSVTPVIISFNPPQVEQYDALTTVYMTGLSFGEQGAGSRVVINGHDAVLSMWTENLIAFHITIDTPPGSNVTVIRADGGAASSTGFMVEPRQHPYILSYDPNSVCAGDTSTIVTMTGVQFGASGTVVLGGMYTATVTLWTDTEIHFTIRQDTPPYTPIFVRVNSDQNGSYLEFGGFGVRQCVTPTATPGRPGGTTGLRPPGLATPGAHAPAGAVAVRRDVD